MTTDDVPPRRRMTDKRAMRRALIDAVEYRRSLIDAYAHMPEDPAVADAKADIAAYERVLGRYFGGPAVDRLANTKSVPLHEIIARMEEGAE